MKKIIFLLVIITLLIAACHRNAMPVITSRPIVPPTPIKNQTPAVTADAVAGKTIFVSRCGHCHVLPDPVQYTMPRWNSILTSMIPKAKLTKEEGDNVTAYIKAIAKT